MNVILYFIQHANTHTYLPRFHFARPRWWLRPSQDKWLKRIGRSSLAHIEHWP